MALQPETNQIYDRASELKAFDATKFGVKGLVDAGITTVPRIFIKPCDGKFLKCPNQHTSELKFPIIDLNGVDEDLGRREKVIMEIVDAAERWGFFQVINHGIPLGTLEEMLKGVRRFHEQDTEAKKQWYTRDETKTVVYNSNFDLYSAPAANWRDTFYCVMAPDCPNPEELPETCRDVMVEYPKQVKRLGCCLFELLSEGLGLERERLKDMGCAEGQTVTCHYYPPCPQPELTFGTSQHVDGGFMTVLLQDEIGGLQVLHQNQWVDVPPTPGALIVNVGDLLQLITNDKFKSVEHRVLANKAGPRVSVACFFTTNLLPNSNLFGPIKELLSEDNPPKYRETTASEYAKCLYAKENIQEKLKDVIETAPRNCEWTNFTDLYQYEGFWHSPRFLQGTLIAQQQFHPQPGDIILCSAPKTGTTWLKALAFATLERDILDDPNYNPLLSNTPHEIVPYLEVDLFQDQKPCNYPQIPLLATHLPYNSLPQPIKVSNCKLIYICRDPKDVFVSMWHFIGNYKANEKGHFPLEKAFELFCRGVSKNGPYWDHVLGYWNASVEYPEKILFVKYEELKRDTKSYVKRIAEFIGHPISSEEENEGVVEKIVKLCSFQNLSNLEVNKKGKFPIFESVVVENKKYFRKGEVGDWKNYLTVEMKERLDQITADKLRCTGFTFD